MFRGLFSSCAATIVLISTSYYIVNATSLLTSQFTVTRGYLEKPLAYVVSDNKYSEKAVRTIIEAVFPVNSFVATERLQLVNLSKTDETRANELCEFVRKSPVVHLTSTCLPDYASRLRIPVLSVPSEGCNSLAHVSFMEGEDGGSELSVLLDVARMMSWKSAVYVGDTTTDTVLLDRLLRYNRSFDLSGVVSVNKEVDPIRLYAAIGQSKVDFVLVHCQSYQCYGIVTKLFYLRNEETIGGSSVPWLITESLTQNARSAISPGPLVVYSTTYGLQKAVPISPHSGILLGDVWSLHKSCYALLHCPVTLQQQLEVLAFYDSLTVLFALVKDSKQRRFKDSDALVRFINEANLNGISRTIRFDHHSSERKQPVLYNVVDIGPSLVAKIGVYDNSESLWLHELRPLDGQQATKRGRYKRAIRKCEPAVETFKVTTMKEPPFVIYDPNNTLAEAHNGPYAGFVVDMMEWLANELRFTYTMSTPPDEKYGSVKDNGTGTGMVGQLMNCEADMAAAAFAITSSRSKYIHFTEPYIDAGKTLLVYKGEATSTSLWAFLSPFEWKTSAVVVACLVAVWIAFAVLRRISIYVEEPECSDGHRRRNVGWPGNPLWFLYTTFMQQGPDDIPSIGGKILVGGWFFFALLIVATYTANLAAFLTVRNFEDSIQSLDDLVAQTETIYGTVKDTSITEFFETSPLEIHKRVHWFMNNVDGALVDTAEEAYDRVHHRTKGDYVFIWDEPILDYITSHEPCKSQVIGRPFIPQGYGFALPKGMPYEFNFTLAVLKMRESGMIYSLRSKWLHSGPCSKSETAQDVTDAEEVHVSDILGIFITLAITTGASLIIGVLELLWRRWNNQRKTKVTFCNIGKTPGQDDHVRATFGYGNSQSLSETDRRVVRTSYTV